MTRRIRILFAVALVAVALLVALYWISRPRSVAAIITDRVGASLGLEITADGASEYRLRGTPMLVLRDLTVREPGAATLLLSARRMHVALPWSTLRAGGSELVARRVELDSPRLDLPALQHWLSTRPPSAKARLPTLTEGLAITDGEIVNNDWRIDGIHADVPMLDPRQSMRARLRGRYVDGPLSIPVDLAVAIVSPEALVTAGTTGFATHGSIAIVHGAKDDSWRVPATVILSGPLRFGPDELRVTPAHLGAAAAIETGSTRVPFALGLHGPLRFDEATWTLAPAGIALRQRSNAESDPIPALDAHGRLALGRKLTLQLDGELARWPRAWPALPPPIGQSQSPLAFALHYDGASNLTSSTVLQLRRDATQFDGRFRLPHVLQWLGQEAGTPLPPVAGTLTTPQLEISGARLEGVEIEFDDSEAAAPGVMP
jgi:hypothetical protein